MTTDEQFDEIIAYCKEVFRDKAVDYGTSWRILRLSSLTDQIYIKANRIRSIQQKGVAKVGEGMIPEFVGIVNYSVMALIQLKIGVAETPDEMTMDTNELLGMYEGFLQNAKNLMSNKNHDYDEAWRQMRISSITDIILMKIYRVKSIEDHNGNTIVSEGIDANYYDMINYAMFCLIRLVLEKES